MALMSLNQAYRGLSRKTVCVHSSEILVSFPSVSTHAWPSVSKERWTEETNIGQSVNDETPGFPTKI